MYARKNVKMEVGSFQDEAVKAAAVVQQDKCYSISTSVRKYEAILSNVSSGIDTFEFFCVSARIAFLLKCA